MLELDYELTELLDTVKDESIKRVLIQLPDGLKPHGGKISEKVREVRPDLILHLWGGDCYGACDTPRVTGYDLFVAFGHSKWKFV